MGTPGTEPFNSWWSPQMEQKSVGEQLRRMSSVWCPPPSVTWKRGARGRAERAGSPGCLPAHLYKCLLFLITKASRDRKLPRQVASVGRDFHPFSLCSSSFLDSTRNDWLPCHGKQLSVIPFTRTLAFVLSLPHPLWSIHPHYHFKPSLVSCLISMKRKFCL